MAQVELKNVDKAFGQTKVIKDVDLSIEKGEFVVFVGPSGCGKSTLLRLIAGLESLSDGKIIKERLLGQVFAVAGQIVDENICSLEDVDRGAKVGLRWAKGPFELMNIEYSESQCLQRIQKF